LSTHGFGTLTTDSLLELFRLEVEAQCAILRQQLLALEKDPNGTHHLEQLMRAAHSIKGAARIVSRSSVVRVAGSMEDCFVAAQDSASLVPQRTITALLRGLDLLAHISKISDELIIRWEEEHRTEIEGLVASLSAKGSSGETLDIPRERSVP
jgi:two-component system, chemotaxis family, sensor histidine kinase and response regulator WspE